MSDQSNCPDFVPFDSAGTPLSARKISTGCGLHLPGSPPGICAAWRLSGAGSSVSGWSPHGGGGVTVWGAISNTGRSQLVRVQGNLTAAQDVLQPHVLPLMGTPGAVFQQDNARSHTARIIVAYFNNQNIRTLPWPSVSPDLSPIEHLWDELDRRLRVRNVPPATPDELFAVLQEDWETIPRQTIQHLIASMPRRCRAVIQANGGHTRY